jgi:hypothetical protein
MEPAKETDNSTLNNEPQAVVIRREVEKDLFVWTAPARPFKSYGKKFYVTIFSIVGIVSIILFVAEGIMPVILLISLIFLFYVLSTVQPEKIEYKITNKGIKIADKETFWQNVVKFCLTKRSDSDVLVFETTTFPGRLQLVVTPEIKGKLKNEISQYIPYQEIQVSTLDKVTDWIVKKLPESE